MLLFFLLSFFYPSVDLTYMITLNFIITNTLRGKELSDMEGTLLMKAYNAI